nr:acylphosphatase [Paramagnetospirillum magneticum]
MTGETSVRVLIEGRVQGVWFRGWVVEQATARKLSGWVRNLVDGRVEALFHGPSHLVRDMVEACHQGPPAAWSPGWRPRGLPNCPRRAFTSARPPDHEILTPPNPSRSRRHDRRQSCPIRSSRGAPVPQGFLLGGQHRRLPDRGRL